MNGADLLIKKLADAGVSACFANPGTSEMQLVAALDKEPSIRAVLGLFEGVVTGAAVGFARMTDTRALTLLHLGPGYANGIANLHNASRARVPVLNMIGDHATHHLELDAPLSKELACASIANIFRFRGLGGAPEIKKTQRNKERENQ